MRRSETVTFGTPPVVNREGYLVPEKKENPLWRNTSRFNLSKIRAAVTPSKIQEGEGGGEGEGEGEGVRRGSSSSSSSFIVLSSKDRERREREREMERDEISADLKKSVSMLMPGSRLSMPLSAQDDTPSTSSSTASSRPKRGTSKFNIFAYGTLRAPKTATMQAPDLTTDSEKPQKLERSKSRLCLNGSLAPRLHKKNLASMFTIDTSSQQQKVIKEILYTEADFVDDCDVIINIYMAALQRVASVSTTQIHEIFLNILEVRYANSEFLQELQQRVIPALEENPNKCPDIGSIFGTIPTRFQCYEMYLAKHDHSMQVLKDLRVSNKEAAEVLQNCGSHPETEKLNLESYLIKPIQRLCKYPLLLQELMKSTTENGAQMFLCQNAKMEIESFISNANDKLKNREKMAQIQKYLGRNEYITLLLEGRQICKEGRLLKIKKEQAKEKYFWLLDNCLLWCNIQKKSILPQKFQKTHRRMIPIINVVSVLPLELPNFNNTFSIQYTDDKNRQQVITLAADSYLEKLLWVQTLEKYL